MKILIATGIFPPEIGGPATYAQFLADRLPAKGIETVVLPFREVRHLPRILRHVAYFWKVVQLGRKVDLIFTQDPVSTGVPVVLAAGIIRKKVVMRVAGDYAWEQSVQRFGVTETIDEFQNKTYGREVERLRKLQKFAVRKAGIVITPSEYFNRLVRGWFDDASAAEKVRTIYNGVDLNSDFERKPKSAEKTIISAGRLVPWKGFDVLIHSLKKLPGWRVIIAGEGPDRSRLEKIIKDNGLEGRAALLGSIPREKLFSEISAAHIFALLSTFESFSFQLVEAMHVGTPVIVGHIGNLAEIVKDGEDGVLIDPTNEDEFAAAVKRIDSDPTYAARISENAKKKATQFSVEKTLEKLVNLFKTL